MTDADPAAEAERACLALAEAYGHLADTWQAEALAALFTEDGVFNRLGREIAGRAAIREFIANRPRDHWQRHRSRRYRFALGTDGTTAEAWSDLEMERGLAGSEQVGEVIRARYHDRFALTAEGWRIRLREVRLSD